MAASSPTTPSPAPTASRRASAERVSQPRCRSSELTSTSCRYDNELGPPWKNLPLYIKMSYPFLEIDKRIHTPMLFMGGTSDMNVPLLGGEQMYQALKSLGRASTESNWSSIRVSLHFGFTVVAQLHQGPLSVSAEACVVGQAYLEAQAHLDTGRRAAKQAGRITFRGNEESKPGHRLGCHPESSIEVSS